MKNYFLAFTVLAMGTVCFTSCGDDDDVVNEQTKVLTFEGDKFSALIDNPQYGGALLYNADEYKWDDADNTNLSCSFSLNGDWGKGWFYGGIAM